MCGIFGIIQIEKKQDTGKIFRSLCLLSESRGKEASGFAVVDKHKIKVFRLPLPSKELVQTKVFKDQVYSPSESFIGIGHSRLVTNGYEHYDENNQPVVKNGFTVIHNGIIVNQEKLWNKYGPDKRASDLDSEIIPTLISEHLYKTKDLGKSIGEFFSEIYGVTNIALVSIFYANLFLATNNGSLHYFSGPGIFVFSSERYILERVISIHKLKIPFGSITQVLPGQTISISYKNVDIETKHFGETFNNIVYINPSLENEILKENVNRKQFINTSLSHVKSEVLPDFLGKFKSRSEQISNLRRCTKCILPETFPYISFDQSGVCNYCRNHKQHKPKGESELKNFVFNFRKIDNRPECLLPFSGGRDSSYVLHFVVKELGLKPLAFSYDWGMITDLARRNQARLCAKLGVEHILISADIRKKEII